MSQQYWGLALLGKGLFAGAAIVLLLGVEPDARSNPAHDVAPPVQQRLTDVRPAPLPTVRANAEMTYGAVPQSWVF